MTYRKVCDIKVGDYVAWWTQAARVVRHEPSGDSYALTVYDEVTGSEKTFSYPSDDELRVVADESTQ